MAIKNYTTTVDVHTSLAEIQGALAKHGAMKIMIDYIESRPIAISFVLNTVLGIRGFRLPATTEGTLKVFQRQKVKADKEQAERCAWRNVRDWVLAQMALIESCDVAIDQIFLPYLTDNSGQTLYEAYSSGQLALGGNE